MPFVIPAALLNVLRPPQRLHSTYERLLGTEVELQIVAATHAQARDAEHAALTEIERLTLILNRFDPNSELSRWQAAHAPHVPLSLDLLNVLRLADHWNALSGGALHPGADAFGELWKQASLSGHPPTPATLARQASALRAEPWELHPDGSGTLIARYPIGLNALAKGYIVDCAATVASRCAGVRSVLVNAGGDLRVIGGRGVTVAVADPFTARDDAPPLTQVRVRGGALATSGSSHRGYQVGDQWYSHVIDPRSGQPVRDVPGVTVIAPECVSADALATTLSVLPFQAGLALAESLPGCEALIITAGGEQHATSGWRCAGPRPARLKPVLARAGRR
ncbi:FAD:protein FMN transferase [Deinococcus knuensis]